MTQDAGLIVLVTTELFPFTSGGIGRLCYNILETMSDADRARSCVILTHNQIDTEKFAKLFPSVRLIQLDAYDFTGEDQAYDWAVKGPQDWLSLSVKLMLILKSLALQTAISFVEFPDWSGYAFATLQEKRLTGFLLNATIAVRLHSTETVLVFAESRLLGQRDLLRYDMERQSLMMCDMIIGHLRPVSDATRAIFGIDSESWNRRLMIAAPPVTLNAGSHPKHSITPSKARHIVFSSKFQECKRPEVFVRGVASFMAARPDYLGDVQFACMLLQNAYTSAVLDAIPVSQRKRYQFHKNLTTSERDQIIAKGIVVFSSGFESYCLAAYEAAAMGAVVVLNSANPAFGLGTPWVDGVNCLKFDGTSLGLAFALERCMAIHQPLDVLVPPREPLPWSSTRPPQSRPRRTQDTGLAIVVVNQSEGTILLDTLRCVTSMADLAEEIVIVDDGSTDVESRLALADLELRGMDNLRIVRLPVPNGFAAGIKAALDVVSAPNVAVLRSGNLVHADYLVEAVQCLGQDPSVDLVCAQVRSFVSNDHLDSGTGQMTPILGEALISGAVQNSFGEFGFVLRSDVARSIGFRAETGYLCDWAFAQSVARKGRGIAVSMRAAIARRTRVERDFGTPIDEYSRLSHLVSTDARLPLIDAPIMRLPMVLQRTYVEPFRVATPDWFAHMIENHYEEEVEFMAGFFGHSRLGRFIRGNRRFRDFMEALVNRLSRLGPKQ